jgi:hypothetical protein
LKVGDLFTIPVDESRVAVGQLADKVHTAWYVIVYGSTYPTGESIAADEVARSPIRIQALTFPARINHGYWHVFGHASIDTASIEWPEFKVMTPKTHVVTDHRGDTIREATSIDRHRLPEMSFVSPMIVEMAAKALFGVGPWQSHFDKLLAPGSRRPSAHLSSRDIARR